MENNNKQINRTKEETRKVAKKAFEKYRKEFTVLISLTLVYNGYYASYEDNVKHFNSLTIDELTDIFYKDAIYSDDEDWRNEVFDKFNQMLNDNYNFMDLLTDNAYVHEKFINDFKQRLESE